MERKKIKLELKNDADPNAVKMNEYLKGRSDVLLTLTLMYTNVKLEDVNQQL